MKLVPVLGNEPFWVLKEKELDDLARRAMAIDCPRMTLTQRGAGLGSKCYEGSGVIVQNPDGPGFVCRLLLGYPLSFDEVFGQSFVPVGQVLPESHFFDLSAIDWRSRRWSAEHLIIDPSSGEDGTIIVASISVLEGQEENHHGTSWNMMSALYWGDINVPFSDWSDYELKWTDGTLLKSGALDSVKISLPEQDIRVHRYLDYTRVDVLADATIPPSYFADVNEALRFVLARKVEWSVLHLLTPASVTVRLRGRLNPPPKSRRRPPVAFGSPDRRTIWNLFSTYLLYLSSAEHGTEFHPIVESVSTSIEAGSWTLADEIHTLTSLVEGLVADLFRNTSATSTVSKADLKRAREAIASLNLDPKVSTRLQEILGNTRQNRAIDKLYKLVEDKLIAEDLVIAWRELRNPSAHGDLLDPTKINEYLQLIASTQVLFYQLIFLAIGYTGPYTDYCRQGSPMRQFLSLLKHVPN